MLGRAIGTGVRLSAALCLAILALAGGACSKRRTARVPVPPPVVRPEPPPAPEDPTPTPPPLETPLALQAPRECQASPHPPWLQCLYRSGSGESMVYYLYLPSHARGAAALPLITFLHGSSGSGSGDGKPIIGGHRHGSGLWIADEMQQRYPSIVLAPQAQPAPGETWVRVWRAPPPGDPRPKEALVLVNEIISQLAVQLPVDRQRLYLTGQSMGGFGAWLAYTRYPGRFAAIVPVCGGGDPGAVVPNTTAVWAFHGDRDRTVPALRSRDMVSAIRGVDGQVRYTEYPGLGHNIFERAYTEPGLVEWLFAQRLESAPPLD